MKRYILRRHIDRFAPGADVTDAYPVEELEKWASEGMARVVEVEEPPVALDDLAPTNEEPVTAPVEPVAPVAASRKRSK